MSTKLIDIHRSTHCTNPHTAREEVMPAHEAEGRWVVDTRELVRRPGAMKTLTRDVSTAESVGTTVVAIRTGENVHLDLRLESVMEGILATGEITAAAVGECVRCLDEVNVPIDVPFQELFVYPERAARHEAVSDDDDEDEVYELEEDHMDLETVIRDAVVTSLPFQPVCRQDCPGLCAQCGMRLEEDPDHWHDVIDPRWSALAELAQSSDHNDEKRN